MRRALLFTACVVLKGAATVVIQNGDPADVGFNDTTPVSPVGGNSGTTLGQQRLIAFQAGANLWGATLNSGPTITVLSTWEALSCTANSATLGMAGSVSVWRDFAGALVPNRWYSSALANKLSGSDLDPANPEIRAHFNVNLGSSGCLTGVYFYLGLDDNHGSNIDLITVVLHEFAHGLGFQTYTDGSTGEELSDGTPRPSIFDNFLLDNTTGLLWPDMTDAQRVASAINTLHLVWNGPNVTAAVPSVLTSGFDGNNRVQMYAPNPYQEGSSVSHWDSGATPNQLMEPALNSDLTHSVTPPQDLTAEMLLDIGWNGSPPATPSLISPANGATGVSTTPTVSWSAASGASSYDVYFGPTSTPVFVTNTTATVYNPAMLAPGGTYYWRVVAKNGWGSSSSGTWSFTTLGSSLPTTVSVTPSAGNGASQTFSFVYSDPNGGSDIVSAQALFNTVIGPTNTCWMLVDPVDGAAYLANDAGTQFLGPITLGTSSTLQNSQCTINGTGSSATTSGTTATVNLMMTFKPSFAGAKKIFGFVEAASGLNSGWQALGTWTVSAAQLQAVSVTPSSGSGANQTFRFVYSDPNGGSDIASAEALFNTVIGPTNTCWVLVDPVHGAAYLANDGDTQFLGPITLGTSATLQNSQCIVNGTGSSSMTSGTTATVNLAVTFEPGFAGAKNIYGYAQSASGSGSGWQTLGVWTVSTSPQVVSVTPSAGSGSSQTFSLVYSDPNGGSDIVSAQVLFNTVIAPTNTCWVLVDPLTRAAYLANDANTQLLGPITLGTSATLQNSQCTIHGTGSSSTTSGTTATVNLAVTFQPAFAGLKNIYGYAQAASGLNSGWRTLGTWTTH